MKLIFHEMVNNVIFIILFNQYQKRYTKYDNITKILRLCYEIIFNLKDRTISFKEKIVYLVIKVKINIIFRKR
jgi:hypothetical protein